MGSYGSEQSSEEFKVCFESYEVSDLGNCRRKRKDGSYKPLRCSTTTNGYKYFQLQREGKRVNKLIHQMVAYCFVGKRPEGLVIDHIDRNKLNNRADNLHYVSVSDNVKNSDYYREDIAETDKRLRHNIIQMESYHRRKHYSQSV